MDEKNKNGRVSIATVLAVVGIIVGPIAGWGAGEVKRGELVEKVNNLEQRQTEDRREVKERLQRIEDKTQRTDENVQQILRKLDVIESRQQQQRRDR